MNALVRGTMAPGLPHNFLAISLPAGVPTTVVRRSHYKIPLEDMPGLSRL